MLKIYPNLYKSIIIVSANSCSVDAGRVAVYLLRAFVSEHLLHFT